MTQLAEGCVCQYFSLSAREPDLSLNHKTLHCQRLKYVLCSGVKGGPQQSHGVCTVHRVLLCSTALARFVNLSVHLNRKSTFVACFSSVEEHLLPLYSHELTVSVAS